MSANNLQGIYTQLPQSLSDSDSDTEINDLKEIKYQNACKQNGHHTNGFVLPNHTVKRRTGFRGMSRARKCAFIFSILFCFLVIIVFLWVLPCTSNQTCPSKIGSWKTEHEGIEFNGRINVIANHYKTNVNIALLAKKSIKKPETDNGAIALLALDGSFNWFIRQVRAPTNMDCNLLDTNNDGALDCLLLSDMGLTAVDAQYGDIIWHGHNTNMIIQNIDMPVALPDLNRDKVNELISVTDWHNAKHNVIILICGRTGQLLASIMVHNCDDIQGFKYDDKLLLFNCKNASHYNYYKVSIGDLQRKIYNSTYPVQATKIEYHPENKVEYISNGHELVVDNDGICPDCVTNITLFDIRNERRIRFEWAKGKSYAMRPIPYSFKSPILDANNKKRHLNGFIMKVWQWSEGPTKANGTMKRTNISEKIMLISFTDTDCQVINISLVQITQLCYLNTLDCQPSLANRNESLLLTDLDADGSHELINYSSTYKCGDSEDSCYLISKMEVVQLEHEMTKLYSK